MLKIFGFQKIMSLLVVFVPLISIPTQARQDIANGEGRLSFIITVDWEGMHLQDRNLDAMRRFRDEFPDVPLVHFLNPAYYTKPDACHESIANKKNTVLEPHDELGLHIHGWDSLFRAAAVEVRSAPTFNGTPVDRERFADDFGYEVILSAYNEKELRKVISYSLRTLDEAGYGRAVSFRAGGWMTDQTVLDALSAEGIRYDHSEVPYQPLSARWGDAPLVDLIKKYWPNATTTSQPYVINTKYGDIIEIPDNGILADYVDGQQMIAIFEENMNLYKANPDENIVVSFGFHQETAARYLSRIENALRGILEIAEKENIAIQFITSESVKIPPAKTRLE